MPNTPEPCCRCGNLYYDVMTEDSPAGAYVECMDRSGNAQWGNENCSQFTTEHWYNKCPIEETE